MLQHSALQDWMNLLLEWEFVRPISICCTIECFFWGFSFPITKLYSKIIQSSNDATISPIWDILKQEVFLYVYIFHSLYLCWLDITQCIGKKGLYHSCRINLTNHVSLFKIFELHISQLKTSGCDPPERGLESLPQAAPWCMVIGDFGMLLWWLLAGWQGSPTPGRFKPVGLKHWKRSKVS